MVRCVLSQLKPSASAFSTSKNVELSGLYPISNMTSYRHQQT